MKMLQFVVLAGLLLVGLYAWKNLPGLRTRVEGTVEEYGGWTEDARKADPVGFLTYAEEKLAQDLGAFRDSRAQLAGASERASQESQKYTGLIVAADDLGAQYKARFRSAESEGTWPIEFKGARYDRSQFLEQVEAILAERTTSEAVLATYTEVVRVAEERDKELKHRITTTRATLQQLAAQKELVRVEKLTTETDELMAQVNELIGGNRDSRDATGEPVRSIEDLLSSADRRSGAPSAPEVTTTALDFLNAD